jgi:SAM-dependent methyltransferase
MRKSMLDKVFFFDKVFEPIESIVDFGCADGSLIKFCKDIFPKYEYVGYDISPYMIEKARENCPSCRFTDKWEDIGVNPSQSLLNLSSVIHEVYSYCSPEEIKDFWDRVFHSGFQYISFRDMMLSCAHPEEKKITDFLNNPNSTSKYLEKLKDFKQIWGKDGVLDSTQAIHYLLKAQYSFYGNWEREVRENYLPITVEEFLLKIPEEYEICYKEHYVFPYHRWWLWKNLGIEWNTPTHFKIVLKKK